MLTRRASVAAIAVSLAMVVATGAFGEAGEGVHARPRQPFDPTTLELAWAAPLQNTLHSSPLVVDDAVYVTQGFLDHTAVHAFPVSCGTDGAVCHRLWRGATGATPRSPVVAGGVLYVVSGSYLNAPQLLAFPAACRTDGGWCDPLWQGIGSEEVIVSEGIVYAGANSHQFEGDFVGPRLYAYEASCGTGGQICQPLWFADLDGDPTAIVSEQGMILVMAGSTLSAFPTACDVVDERCEPAWTAVVPGSVRDFIVANGVAYVLAETEVSAFPTACGTGGATCVPEWIGATPQPTFLSGLAAGDGLVYVSSDQQLFAYREDCGSAGATCAPIWKTGLDLGPGFPADPVAADGMVVVGGSQLFAFESTCASNGDTCAPAWVSPDTEKFRQTTPKTLSEGYVLLGWGLRLLAFPLSCGTGGAVCLRAWGRPTGKAAYVQPVVAGDSVYYVSDQVYTFQP